MLRIRHDALEGPASQPEHEGPARDPEDNCGRCHGATSLGLPVTSGSPTRSSYLFRFQAVRTRNTNTMANSTMSSREIMMYFSAPGATLPSSMRRIGIASAQPHQTRMKSRYTGVMYVITNLNIRG